MNGKRTWVLQCCRKNVFYIAAVSKLAFAMPGSQPRGANRQSFYAIPYRQVWLPSVSKRSLDSQSNESFDKNR